MRIDKNTKIYLGQTEIVKIKKGNVVIWESEPAVEVDYLYLENTYNGSNTVTFTTNASISLPSSDKYSNQVEYSTDKVNWTTLTFDTSSPSQITINQGEKLYLRNDSGVFNWWSSSNYYYTQINPSQSCILGGNVNTLLDYNNADNLSLSGKYGCFYKLFSNSHITDASGLKLPATSLSLYCYQNMFNGCTALTTAPTTLPATTLVSSCYESMFYGCTSLTTAPALPATTLGNSINCYQNMFYGCTSLTTAPALPATTLGNSSNCYSGMFYNCRSLISAPALPATTLTQDCYYHMFDGCTSLTTAPALPATTLDIQCYSGMFIGCTSLTTTPALPATTLKQGCYHSMFLGCTSLTTAPALPATTLVDSCYKNMFLDCTSLTTAPALPATTLAIYCYHFMFQGCTSLTSAPVLPATTLAEYCYGGMFKGCSNLNTVLTYADDISASDCTLEWLDNVAASGTLYNGGSAVYTTDSPSGIPTGWSEVAAPTTSVYAVPDTFSAKSWQDKNRCDFTLMGRNVSGIDIPIGKMSELVTIGKNTGSSTVTHTETLTYDGLDYTITINQSANDTDEPNYFYVETIDSDNVVNVNNYKKNNNTVSDLTPTIEYSTDKVNWNVITLDWTNTGLQQTISLNNVGDKVYFRNDTGLFSNTINISNRYKYIYFTFGQNKQVNVGGDLRSLLDYRDVENANMTKDGMFQNLFSPDNYSSSSNVMMIVDASSLVLPTNMKKYAYFSMFRGCTSLTTAPALPATTLEERCYTFMFYGCTALTTAPALPATTLTDTCYSNMFNGCTALTSAPSLPATTLATYCYYHMFDGCTALTTAPVLPATTLATYCYSNMFNGCTSLTTAPALPATTLTERCYDSMFINCTSLTTAPTLPATTLATYCYSNMFYGCTALTTAPALPATTLVSYCYSNMFNGCTALTSAPSLPATTLATYCYYHMFDGCTALTTAPVLPATTLVSYCYSNMFNGCTVLTTAPALPATTLASYCYSNMFNGCTALTSAPALPATTLANYCYQYMFDGCTALTTAPVLPATTLATYCYSNMFNGCSSLNSVTCYAQDISASSCLNNWLQNVSSTGTFNNNGFVEYPSGNSGIPTGWTEVLPIQSIVANPDTFTLKSYKTKVNCASTLTITTTVGTTVTKTNSVTLTVGENTGDSTRTLTETIPYKGSSYQVTIVQTANDPAPTWSWDVVSTGTYPFELNSNDYYESTNKGHDNSYSYATLNYSGFDNLVLECINYGENKYDYGIISQPDVLLSESITDDGATGSENVFHNFKQESSATPVQLTIPSDGGSHFITIKYRKDTSQSKNNDSLQFKVVEPS